MAGIGGDATFYGRNEPEVDPDADLASPIEFKQAEEEHEHPVVSWATAFFYFWTAAFIFGAVLMLITPEATEEIVTKHVPDYGKSFVTGVVSAIVLLASGCLVTITIVGAPLGMTTLLRPRRRSLRCAGVRRGLHWTGDPGNPDERERRPRPPCSRLVPDSCREVDPVCLVRRDRARRPVGFWSACYVCSGTISRYGTAWTGCTGWTGWAACTGARGSSLIRTIQEFFSARITVTEETTPVSLEHAQKLATAALLIEISRADFEIADEEKLAIEQALRDSFGISDEETREIIALAEQEVNEAISLYEFTRLVDKGFTAEQKKAHRRAFVAGRVQRRPPRGARGVLDPENRDTATRASRRFHRREAESQGRSKSVTRRRQDAETQRDQFHFAPLRLCVD